MAVSVRTRFEVFKRDDFTCQYCGRKSPDVVLELDHIVPVCEGGTDDTINLRTSCWDCNHGKAGVPLAHIVTGEDPHDKAIQLLERERQLREYNAVLVADRARREDDAWDLVRHWKSELGWTTEKDLQTINRKDFNWLMNALTWCPKEQIREFMDLAIGRNMINTLRYVAACARNWRYERMASDDWKASGDPYV